MSGSVWKRWNWIELGLIPAIVTIMRVAWIAPLVQLLLNNLLVHPVNVVFPVWWLLALMLGATALKRWLDPRRWGLAVAVALGLVAVPITWALALGFRPAEPLAWLWGQIVALTDFGIGIPSGLILMLVTMLVWSRGLAVVAAKYTSVWASFVLGTLTLGGLMLFRVETLLAIPAMHLTASMVTFVLAGLLALALLSLTGTLEIERRRGSGAMTINQFWLLGILSLVLAIILLGWLLGLVLSPETVVLVLRFFGPLWQAIAFLILAFATLIAFLTAWLLEPMMVGLYQRALPVIREFNPADLRAQIMEHAPTERSPLHLGFDWQAVLRPLFVLAVVGLGVWLFVRAWQRLRRNQDPNVVETRESILSAGLLRQQVVDLFRRRRAPATGFMALDPEGSARDAIRACYQGLLASMQKAGLPRPKGATPLDYDAMLVEHWPDEQARLDALTEEYVRARYAPEEPGDEQVARAQQAWLTLQRRANADTARR